MNNCYVSVFSSINQIQKGMESEISNISTTENELACLHLTAGSNENITRNHLLDLLNSDNRNLQYTQLDKIVTGAMVPLTTQLPNFSELRIPTPIQNKCRQNVQQVSTNKHTTTNDVEFFITPSLVPVNEADVNFAVDYDEKGTNIKFSEPSTLLIPSSTVSDRSWPQSKAIQTNTEENRLSTFSSAVYLCDVYKQHNLRIPDDFDTVYNSEIDFSGAAIGGRPNRNTQKQSFLLKPCHQREKMHVESRVDALKTLLSPDTKMNPVTMDNSVYGAKSLICNANVVVERLVFQWEVPHFKSLRKLAILNALPAKDRLNSNQFGTSKAGIWHLTLFPYGDINTSQHVSLYLFADDEERRRVAEFSFVLIDQYGNEVDGTAKEEKARIFTPEHLLTSATESSSWGWVKFLNIPKETVLDNLLIKNRRYNKDGVLCIRASVTVYSCI